MQIKELNVAGYRSIRQARRLRLERLNLVIGANGCGKTNLYRSLELLRAAAAGRLAGSLLEEGGMPAVLWRGDRRKGPVRMIVGVEFEELDYELQLGLPQPSASAFTLDPEIKLERLRLAAGNRRVGAMERVNTSAWIRDESGRRVQLSNLFFSSESILSELREPARFPVLSVLRNEFLGWHASIPLPSGSASHPATPGVNGFERAGNEPAFRYVAGAGKLDRPCTAALAAARDDPLSAAGRFDRKTFAI